MLQLPLQRLQRQRRQRSLLQVLPYAFLCDMFMVHVTAFVSIWQPNISNMIKLIMFRNPNNSHRLRMTVESTVKNSFS